MCKNGAPSKCSITKHFSLPNYPLFVGDLSKPLSERMGTLLKNAGPNATLAVIFDNIADMDTAKRVADILTVVPTESLWNQVSFPKLSEKETKEIMEYMMSRGRLDLSMHPPP